MKIKVTIFSIAIFLVVLGIVISFNNKNEESINVNAIPIMNKTIVLDAGHGLPDQGAEGVYGTTEQLINLQITFKIQEMLEQSGVNVILTRSDENGIYSKDKKSIYDKKVSDIKNRVEIVNNSQANILVSIHLNKYPQDSIYRGWQTFYKKDNAQGMSLAESIQKSINSNIEYNNTRTCHSIKDIYLIDNIVIPGVIVECGFLSNYEETELLLTDEYQNKIAWGIYLGIINYFKEEEENEGLLG